MTEPESTCRETYAATSATQFEIASIDVYYSYYNFFLTFFQSAIAIIASEQVYFHPAISSAMHRLDKHILLFGSITMITWSGLPN